MKFSFVLLALVVAVSNAAYNAAQATGAVAYQTSTGWGGVASRAIDNNIASKWNSKSCTQTGTHGSSQYWEVKLPSKDLIHEVLIFNRLDCCQSRINGAQVWVGNHKCGTVSYRRNQQSYKVECKGNIMGDKVRIYSGPSYLTLCEVQVVATKAKGTTSAPKLYNVAQKAGAVAFQTSTGWGGVASRAIDNNISSRWNSKSCTQTGKKGSSQYWEVKLTKKERIFSVTLYNRLDCCQNRINGVQVWVGKHKCGTVAYKNNQQAYTLTCNLAVGNKVRVVSGPSYLTLCEVKVFAADTSG